jgi:hypothetical protein
MEPATKGNTIKISYTGGWFQIPKTCTWAVVQVVKSFIQDQGNAKSLKTGSFAVVFKERAPIQAALDSLANLQL